MQQKPIEQRRLELKLIYLCAPLIKKVKATCLITLPKEEAALLRSILARSGISMLPLAYETRPAFLLFRVPLLKRLLSKQRHISFLREYGYQDFSVHQVLSRFSRRYQNYVSGSASFPHESGLLFGYPLTDIRCFIQYHGKFSLFGGYWQVYHQPHAAKQKFRFYDRLRYICVMQYKQGASFQEICR